MEDDQSLHAQERSRPPQSGVRREPNKEDKNKPDADLEQKPAASLDLPSELQRKEDVSKVAGKGAQRSPSPDYADAVEEQAGMGETAERKESKKVGGGGGGGGGIDGVQRITLSRDPKQMNKTSDLGIGVKVAGGVKCEKCGNLHTVITDVQGNSAPQLYKGLAVVGWCGHDLDGASFEKVRSVLVRTEEEKVVEILVKECRGQPEVESEAATTPTTTAAMAPQQDAAASAADSVTSPSATDREGSPTAISLSPSPSHTSTSPGTPAPSSTSTRSPTPPSPPPLRRGVLREGLTDPRPASINLPAFWPQGDVVKPKLMLNDVPTSPPSIVGPLRKYTIESFMGGAPTASIHLSLRYREEDGHLRILLHEVKAKTKKGSNSPPHEPKSPPHGHRSPPHGHRSPPHGHRSPPHGHRSPPNGRGSPSHVPRSPSHGRKSPSHGRRSHFINVYLLPDEKSQGVRACEVLSHVSDLENPPSYTILHKQLESSALRVILWEAKGKHQNFVGEVLLSLADNDVVKLQGLPGWFPMCVTDPNLPPLPSPVIVKKTKKDDLFHRVRRGTGYALQSLRRPVSMGIDILGLESSRMSPSSSMENLANDMKKFQRAGTTMPRNVKKERRPLTGLFGNPPSAPPLANNKHDAKENGGTGEDFVDFVDTEYITASLSVPTSPLLARRATSMGRESGRRKKLSNILGILKGSLLPSQSVDIPLAQVATVENYDESGRRMSQSMELKRRQIPFSPLSTSSSPSSSPLHKRIKQVMTREDGSDERLTLRAEEEARHGRTEGSVVEDGTSPEGKANSSRRENQDSDVALDSLTAKEASLALISDSSWYSAEEDLSLTDLSRKRRGDDARHKVSTATNSALHFNGRNFSRPNDNNWKMNPAAKARSRSADDLLDVDYGADVEQREYPIPGPLTQELRVYDRSRLVRDSSASSMEYNTADSRPVSTYSSSDEPGESSLDTNMRIKMIGRMNAITSTPHPMPVSLAEVNFGRDDDREHNPAVPTVEESASSVPLSRWRSFDDLLGSLPFKKLKPKWLRRNRTHHGLSGYEHGSSTLRRRSSEPTKGSSVGSVKLELTFNPDTSIIGVRLLEHTLNTTNTDLTAQTLLFSRVSVDGSEKQNNAVSFKKTHYADTLIASFHSHSTLHDMTLQVSLETTGRFFNRRSSHVMLDLGALLPPSPSPSCRQWFPLFHTPRYPPTEQNSH